MLASTNISLDTQCHACFYDNFNEIEQCIEKWLTSAVQLILHYPSASAASPVRIPTGREASLHSAQSAGPARDMQIICRRPIEIAVLNTSSMTGYLCLSK